MPFLFVLVFWLMMLFLGYGLLSRPPPPPFPTVVVVLAISAVSVIRRPSF